MKILIKAVTGLILAMSVMFAAAQQPSSQIAPLDPINAKYLDGVGNGYTPTAGSGFTLNLSGGTVNCAGTMRSYSPGTLTMAASSTNYVYLNVSNSCVPSTKTTPFVVGDFPIAVVTTNGSAIVPVTGINESRTMFQVGGGSGGGGITQTTGDVLIGPGSGTLAAILPSVNSNVGTCGDATHVGEVTLNAKGLTTACTPVAISGSGTPAVKVNGTSTTNTNLSSSTPAAPSGYFNAAIQSDGTNVSVNLPNGALGLSLAPNTNYIFCCDSRLIIASSCNTSNLDRGPITSGVVTGGVAVFQTTNNYGDGDSTGGYVGNTITLSQFTGTSLPLNGQRVVLTGQTGSTITANVSAFGVPDGPTGSGYQGCSYNAAGLLAASPYLPLSSTVHNISIPAETLDEVVANYSTLIHPWAPSITGKAAVVIFHAGDGDLDNCTTPSPASTTGTIENMLADIWSDMNADEIQIAQTSLLPDNGSIYCHTADIIANTAAVNQWIMAQTPAAFVQNGSSGVVPGWDYFAEFFSQAPDPTDPTYYINPTGQTHGTDQLNYVMGSAIEHALLFGKQEHQRQYCNDALGEACQNTTVNFYNATANAQGVSNAFNSTFDFLQTDSFGSIGLSEAAVIGGTPSVYYWWEKGLNFIVPYGGGLCSGTNAAGRTVAGICLTQDPSVPNQLDVGNGTVGNKSSGWGAAWILGPATAPTLSSSCSVGGEVVLSQDKVYSVCDSTTHVWEQPFNATTSCGVDNIPCTNTSNSFNGTQTVVTASPTQAASIEQGSSGSLTPLFVQSTTGSYFGSAVSTGDAIVLICSAFGGLSASDSLGNYYSNVYNLSSYFNAAVFVASNITGGSLSFTGCSGVAMEFSHVATASIIDASSFGACCGDPLINGPLTTTVEDMLVSGLLPAGSTVPVTGSASGYSSTVVGANGKQMAYKLAATPGSYNAVWAGQGSGNNGQGWILALKAGTSSGQIADLHQYKAASGALLGGVASQGVPYLVPVLYSALPTSPVAGQLAVISDASGTTTWHSAASGSGTPSTSTTYGVLYTGSSWVYSF